jgi:hypothetical protein
VETETQDDIDYNLFSVDGGGLAVADGTPILPYIEGYTLPLPFGATVTNVEVVDSTSSSIGTYNIPTALVSPWTEGGLSYTMETDIGYPYPVDGDLVQYQETSEGLLFIIFPIRHNPTTGETTFYSHFVIEVTYESPLPMVVTEFTTDKAQYVPGEEISTTARVENVGDVAATLTATLTIRDALGEVMGTQTAGEFTVPSGGWHVLPLAWSGPLDDGAYTAQIIIESDSAIVGGASTFVSLLGGEITDFSVPVTLDVGEEGTFQVTFANYRDVAVSGDVTLNIQASEGGFTEELTPQPITVVASSTETATFNWTPTGVATGDYNAVAAVAVDGQDYGPTSRAFTVGGSPPNTPSNPYPANHATGVSVSADLSWTGGDPDAGDTVTYDVYFGTSATPPLKETIGPYPATQSSLTYDPGTLSDNTKYYWQIIATDNHAASTVGPVWDFTTGQPGSTVAWFCPLGGYPLIAPNPGAGRPDLTVPADCAGITVSAGAELWGIYYLVETGPQAGTWLWYIPGFATSTLTQLEPGKFYWVVVSDSCTLTIPQG